MTNEVKIIHTGDLHLGMTFKSLGEKSKLHRRDCQDVFSNIIDLTKSEKEIFNKKEDILKLIGGKPKKVKDILVSETMRLDTFGYKESVGIWEEHNGRVIIKRTQLRNIKSFAGTLLHEVAHATSGANDVSGEFEDELTKYLGIISNINLDNKI